MLRTTCRLGVALFLICWGLQLVAKEPSPENVASVVPSMVKFSGVVTDVNGEPLSGTLGMTFYLYKDQQGGAPIWMETQNVKADATGHYSVMLGAAKSLTVDFFSAGDARWLAVQPAGQPEQPRVLLLSVPYALKAADAQTLGGLPPSAFVMARSPQSSSGSSSDTKMSGDKRSSSATRSQSPGNLISGTGTVGDIAMWTTTTNLGNSAFFQNSSANVGLGNSAPTVKLDVTGTIRGTQSAATSGTTAVTGNATATGTGPTYGVQGSSATSTGAGVFGQNAQGGFGVLGQATGTSGQGVWGESFGTTFINGNGPDGVHGVNHSNQGAGVAGLSIPTGNNPAGIGVYGSGAPGIYGNGRGFFDVGVTGNSRFGTGVYGSSSSGSAVYGTSSTGNGVYGISSSGFGVYGINVAGDTSSGGVYGTSTYGQGGIFQGGTGQYEGQVGVIGLGGNRSDDAIAGDGGQFIGGVPEGDGVYANGDINDPYSYAAYFNGNVVIYGNLQKSGGSFKIDHPLDPAHKYLYHSFVESPDMMNIYNGNVVTDANGNATVTLPDWFESLNRDFRYQLTVLGQFAQAMVASELSHGKFTIKTDKPQVKVSWQVTGIRQDVWANAHRIPVEEVKPPREQGFYTHPELYGQPEEKGVAWVRHSQVLKLAKQMRVKTQSQKRN